MHLATCVYSRRRSLFCSNLIFCSSTPISKRFLVSKIDRWSIILCSGWCISLLEGAVLVHSCLKALAFDYRFDSKLKSRAIWGMLCKMRVDFLGVWCLCRYTLSDVAFTCTSCIAVETWHSLARLVLWQRRGIHLLVLCCGRDVCCLHQRLHMCGVNPVVRV